MNKTRLNAIVAVSLLGLAFGAQAGGRGHQQSHYQDWARVTNVQPQYERVNVPRQQCTNEIVYDQRGHYGGDRSVGGALVGGVAGGLLGSQVGKGNGKTAATAAGAIVGAIVGDRIDNNGYQAAHYPPRGREVQRCYTVDNWESRLTGYNVTYEYNGRRYTQFMNQHPGNRMRVNVSVSPAGVSHVRAS